MNSRRFVVFLLIVLSVNNHAANWLDEMINEKPGFSTDHGLVFFYGSQCPYCKQFSPVLKHWSIEKKMSVLPLSFDNQPLPEFDKFLPVSTEWINAAFQQNNIQYPALFVVNIQSKTLYPIGFGAMTLDELSQRMAALVPKILQYENKRNDYE